MNHWAFAAEWSGAGTGHALSAWLFLRLLGLVYLAAFLSLAVQIRGLVGRDGILPAANFLAAHRRWGARRFLRLPTLCWWNASDGMLQFLCWGGAALALLLIAGFAPLPVSALLWLFYLSLFTIGQVFLRYQWDQLLLEAGFLAIFLAPAGFGPEFPPTSDPPRIVVWLYWWLMFRLMFFSGVVKWRHGDPSWRKLTALAFHFETQPLPTRLAWWARRLPIRVLKCAAGVMLAVELFVPWLMLAPAPWRHGAATAFALLLVVIQFTGNYGFFQLLGLALCVLLLDDSLLTPVLNWATGETAMTRTVQAPSAATQWAAALVALLVVGLSVERILASFHRLRRWPAALTRWFDLLEPFQVVNHYGLFAVMTKTRPEIVIESSDDGVTWNECGLNWKPGDVNRPPRCLVLHLPRLDWQMWFAAQEAATRAGWFREFLARLSNGSPAVLALVGHDPFAHVSPHRVRAVLYDYRFATRAERRASGQWWVRDRRATLAIYPAPRDND